MAGEVFIAVALLIVASSGIIFLATATPSSVGSVVVASSGNVVSSSLSSGGVSSLPLPVVSSPVARIDNLLVCGNVPPNCYTDGLSSSNVVVYWEVVGGVGCCHSFGCDYDAFIAFCGTPFVDFRLYDVVFDGVLVDWWRNSNDFDYVYVCSNGTVYNYHVFSGVSVGVHSIAIVQKDCVDVVDIRTINFTLTESDGKYYIWG
jgi:hypothetical protein